MSEGTSPGSATVTSGGERASSAPRKAAMSVCRVTGRPASLSATRPVSSRQNTSYSSTMRIPCERKKPMLNLKDVRIAIQAVASLYNLCKNILYKRGPPDLEPAQKGARSQSEKRCPRLGALSLWERFYVTLSVDERPKLAAVRQRNKIVRANVADRGPCRAKSNSATMRHIRCVRPPFRSSLG